MGVIYVITNKINNKKYVGMDSSGNDYRWKCHVKCSRYKNPTQLIDKKIKEYGLTNFVYQVIDECETVEELRLKEMEYIKKLNTFCGDGLGYNRTIGGDGVIGYKMTEEQKQKISGKNHYNYGKHHSEQAKLKRSLAMKGKHAGDKNPFKRPEIRKLLSEIAKKRTGINNPNYRHGNRCGINKPRV